MLRLLCGWVNRNLWLESARMDLGADTPDYEDAPCPPTCLALQRDVLKAATSLATIGDVSSALPNAFHPISWPVSSKMFSSIVGFMRYGLKPSLVQLRTSLPF